MHPLKVEPGGLENHSGRPVSFILPVMARGLAGTRKKFMGRVFRIRPQPLVCNTANAKPHRQSPLPLAGKTEISAALVQPFALISRKAVKRKNRAPIGAKVAA